MGDNTNSANAMNEQLEMFEARLMKRFDDRLHQVLQRFNPPPNQPNGGGAQGAGQREAPVHPEHGPPPPPPPSNNPPPTGSESDSSDASYRPPVRRRPRTSRNPSRNHSRNHDTSSRRSRLEYSDEEAPIIL